MTQTPTETIGRAKAVLVFGTGSAAKAVVTSVVVRLRRRSERGRLLPTGSVVFEPSLLDHLVDTVLSAVDRMMELLGLSPQCFELSVVNIGAASAVGLGANVSGFSLDTPIFLALLSAGLKMPIRQDVIATGHIASPDGDVRAVEHIPAKLAAAATLPSITRFLYPALDADLSLEAFAPSAGRTGSIPAKMPVSKPVSSNTFQIRAVPSPAIMPPTTARPEVAGRSRAANSAGVRLAP